MKREILGRRLGPEVESPAQVFFSQCPTNPSIGKRPEPRSTSGPESFAVVGFHPTQVKAFPKFRQKKTSPRVSPLINRALQRVRPPRPGELESISMLSPFAVLVVITPITKKHFFTFQKIRAFSLRATFFASCFPSISYPRSFAFICG